MLEADDNDDANMGGVYILDALGGLGGLASVSCSTAQSQCCIVRGIKVRPPKLYFFFKIPLPG